MRCLLAACVARETQMAWRLWLYSHGVGEWPRLSTLAFIGCERDRFATMASVSESNGPQSPSSVALGGVRPQLPVLAILGTLLGLGVVASFAVTYLVFNGIIEVVDLDTSLTLLMGLNFVLAFGLVALLVWSLVKFFVGRQRGQGGSRIHVRLVGMFTIAAVVPAIVAAAASVLILNFFLETAFNSRVENAINASVDVARVYVADIQNEIAGETAAMAQDLDAAAQLLDANPIGFSEYVARQAQLRSFLMAAVVARDGEILAIARTEGLESVPPPLEEAYIGAEENPVVVRPINDELIMAFAKLPSFEDAYLYVIRGIDAQTVNAFLTAAENLAEFEEAKDSRFQIQALFAVGFVMLGLLMLLFAVLTGLSAAGRIVAPIGRLVGAAERVSEGDLTARVDVGREDDEVATLGRAFNRMTGQLQTQRNELIEANRQYDRRRRFTEAVLSGVTAGVLGLDGKGRITLVNRSALALLGAARADLIGKPLWDALPELGDPVREAVVSGEPPTQGEVELHFGSRVRNLTIQITAEAGVGEATEGGAAKGYVVTFDDVTDLVSAQRMSAWADVARRIAHEIKNPLTPIQLSAERLKRKYKKEITSNPEVFDQCTDTIIRQVADIGQMVDEFSAFARMPEAVLKPRNINETIREVVFLQKLAHKNTDVKASLPDEDVVLNCDTRQLSQAIINIIKNAAEAVETRRKNEGDETIKGYVQARVVLEGDHFEIQVIDNGCGLPTEKRHRLAEPYVTTREKGTGLGLAIVKKIMEDHKGELIIENAPTGFIKSWDRVGARIRLVFPAEATMNDAMLADDGIRVEG